MQARPESLYLSKLRLDLPKAMQTKDKTMYKVSRKNAENEPESVTQRRGGLRRKDKISVVSINPKDPTRFQDESDRLRQSDKDNLRAVANRKRGRVQNKAKDKGRNDEIDFPDKKRSEMRDGRKVNEPAAFDLHFSSKGNRKSPITTEHIKAATSQVQLFKCEVCDACFLSKTSLWKHWQRNVHNIITFPCKICDFTFPATVLPKHIAMHHERSGLGRENFHVVSLHAGISSYFARNCKDESGKRDPGKIDGGNDLTKALTKRSSVEILVDAPDKNQTEIGDKREVKNQGVSHENKLYKCSECDVHYITQSLLFKHRCRNYGRKKYKVVRCASCDLSFNQITLPKHIVLHHVKQKLGRKDFVIKSRKPITRDRLCKCEECDAHFLSWFGLEAHVKRKQHDMHLVLCKACDIGFSVRSLTRHLAIHHRMGMRRKKFEVIVGLHHDEDESDSSEIDFKNNQSNVRETILNSTPKHVRCRVVIESAMTENVRRYLERKTVHELSETSHQTLENLIVPDNCISERADGNDSLSVETESDDEDFTLHWSDDDTDDHDGIYEVSKNEVEDNANDIDTSDKNHREINVDLHNVKNKDVYKSNEDDIPNSNGPEIKVFKVQDSDMVLAHSLDVTTQALDAGSVSADNNCAFIKIKNTFSLTSGGHQTNTDQTAMHNIKVQQ